MVNYYGFKGKIRPSLADQHKGSPYNVQSNSEAEQTLMMPSKSKGIRGQTSFLRKLFLSFWYGGSARRNCFVLVGAAALLFVIFYRGSYSKFLFPSQGSTEGVRTQIPAPQPPPPIQEEKKPENPPPPPPEEEKKPAEVPPHEEEKKPEPTEEKKPEPPQEEEKKPQSPEEEKKPEPTQEQKKPDSAQEEKKPETSVKAGAAKTLTIDGIKFKLGDEDFQILSGAIHYFRVPPEYWKDRMKKLKACGLNTVETYVPWNLHEKHPGNFTFHGILDLEKFIKLAQEEGLYVILRPGPYICAEWDLGGLPSWLLEDRDMKLRTTYPKFKEAVERYFGILMLKVVPHQLSHGGPIIMVQVENEYGNYYRDENYLGWLCDLLVKLGIKEKLFTSDPIGELLKGQARGELMVVNGKGGIGLSLDKLRELQPNKPLMVGEFWTGWFDHWGEKHHTLSVEQYTQLLGEILERNASVNLFMFHGGTNFGFLNGANTVGGGLAPHVTSYDYDAPVSESGDLTPKFFATCKAIAEKTKTGYEYKEDALNQLKTALPPPKDYGRFEISEFMLLQDALKILRPNVLNSTVPMEQICTVLTHSPETTNNSCQNQNFGFIVYSFPTKQGATNLHLKLKFADRLQVIINNEVVHTEELSETGELDKEFKLTEKENVIYLLVENMGRANYGGKLNHQRKGILESTISVDGVTQSIFLVYSLGLCPSTMKLLASDTTGLWKPMAQRNPDKKAPGFYRTLLTGAVPPDLKENEYPADTFLNYKEWTKGAAFLNGKNLGRYWNIGPQKTLYIPGPRLIPSGQKTMPELIMFELHKPDTAVLLQAKPELG